MSEFLEPFAIRMANDSTNASQHWLLLTNGRGSGTRAWVPEASLTLMITWRCSVEKTVMISLEDLHGVRRQVLSILATKSGQATVMNIVPQQGEVIRALPSTIGAGEKAELVITVVPTPFSE